MNNKNKTHPFMIIVYVIGWIVLGGVFIGGCMQDFRLTNW